mgnify:CR=1 FL=1
MSRSSKGLELGITLRVMNALLEVVELRLAHAHLSVHLKQAFSSFVEWLEADRLELKVLRVASENIKSLFLRVLRMSFQS